MTITGYNSYIYSGLYTNNTTFSSLTNQDLLVNTTQTINNIKTQQKSQLATALKDVRDSFNQLGIQANSISTSKNGNIFDKRGAVSADPTVLTAKAADKATMGSYAIEVKQLAKANETTGNALDANAVTSITAGSNTFGIDIGGVTKNVSVDITATDTNKTALTKMAKAINEANAGVAAKVVNETVDGVAKSKIVLTSAQTGTENAFSLTSGSGNILATTNAGNETTVAQNANYVVNGQSFVAQSNNIKLDNGKLNVTLNKTTDPGTTVDLNVKQDLKAISSQVTDFVKQYNNTVNKLNEDDGLINKSVLRGLTSFANNNRYKLSDIGVTVNADKTLNIDQTKLEKALTSDFDKTKNLLGGVNGLASAVGEKARSIVSASMGSLVDNASMAKQQEAVTAQVKQQLNEYMYNSNMNMFNLKSFSSGSFLNTYI